MDARTVTYAIHRAICVETHRGYDNAVLAGMWAAFMVAFNLSDLSLADYDELERVYRVNINEQESSHHA